MVLSLAATTAWAADAYRLGISDRIALKVIQWLPSESAFRQWDVFGGEYSVSPTGTVLLPFVGETQASGKTQAELAGEVSAQLTDIFALTSHPDVSIEIAAYGPVYITGDVTTPGEYAFRPELNVVKAISLAGGLMKSSDLGAERDLIGAQGNYSVLLSQLRRLIATKARLEAELDGKSQVAAPDQLASAEDSDANVILAAEQAILLANSSRVTRQEQSLDEYAQLLAQQLSSLEQKQTGVEAQLVLARQERDNVVSLADSGLAANSRVSQLQQAVSDLETRLLDIGVAIQTAQRDINTTERNRLAIGDDRNADLTAQLQQVNAQIAELQPQLMTQQSLLLYSATLGARGGADAATYRYSIVRGQDMIAATDITALQPGDVVRVERDLEGDLTLPISQQ